MRDLQIVKELLKIAILSMVVAAAIFAAIHPSKLGKWLQTLDTARYEYLDCDCTEPLE